MTNELRLYDIGGRVESYQLDKIIECVDEAIHADCAMLGIHRSEADQVVKEKGDKNEIAQDMGIKLVCLKRLRMIKPATKKTNEDE